MAFDILYVEDGYVDAHYFAGTYAGASTLSSVFNISTDPSRIRAAAALVASAGTLTAAATKITQIPGNASISASADLSAVGTVSLGIEGSANLSSVATVAVTAVVGLGIEADSAVGVIASCTATGSRNLRSSADLTGVVTSVTVAGRRLTETALIVSSGTLSGEGIVARAGASSMNTVAQNSTLGRVTVRSSFAIGSSVDLIPEDISNSYQQSNTAIPSVDFDLSAELSQLFLDDYLYIIAYENREYRIRQEQREYSVKE
jgi:hypothetical protein